MKYHYDSVWKNTHENSNIIYIHVLKFYHHDLQETTVTKLNLTKFIRFNKYESGSQCVYIILKIFFNFDVDICNYGVAHLKRYITVCVHV